MFKFTLGPGKDDNDRRKIAKDDDEMKFQRKVKKRRNRSLYVALLTFFILSVSLISNTLNSGYPFISYVYGVNSTIGNATSNKTTSAVGTPPLLPPPSSSSTNGTIVTLEEESGDDDGAATEEREDNGQDDPGSSGDDTTEEDDIDTGDDGDDGDMQPLPQELTEPSAAGARPCTEGQQIDEAGNCVTPVPEICDNGIDDDYDGLTDTDDSDCAAPPPPQDCPEGTLRDADTGECEVEMIPLEPNFPEDTQPPEEGGCPTGTIPNPDDVGPECVPLEPCPDGQPRNADGECPLDVLPPKVPPEDIQPPPEGVLPPKVPPEDIQPPPEGVLPPKVPPEDIQPPPQANQTSNTTEILPRNLEICLGSFTSAMMIGTDGNDRLIGTSSKDVIRGLSGNDYIDGLGGDDVICGDEGEDEIIGGTGQDTISGGSDNDNITGGMNSDGRTRYGNSLYGDEGDDIITGEWEYDYINGGEGRDIIDGKNGGGALYGMAGRDDITGGNGRDLISGGEGRDKIWGLDGDDHLFGWIGGDEIYGGYDNDYIDGGEGVDYMYGDNNKPLGDPRPTSSGISGRAFDPRHGNDNIVDTGSSLDYIYGENKDDILEDKGGGGFLFGGYGSDKITTGSGRGLSYYVDGGQRAYIDEVCYVGLAPGILDYTLFYDCPTGFGIDSDTRGGDEIITKDGNDRVYGGAGDDMIISAEGRDKIHGEWGEDYMFVNGRTTGPEGRAYLHGGSGDDYLYGLSEYSSDIVLIGGRGDDICTAIDEDLAGGCESYYPWGGSTPEYITEFEDFVEDIGQEIWSWF